MMGAYKNILFWVTSKFQYKDKPTITYCDSKFPQKFIINKFGIIKIKGHTILFLIQPFAVILPPKYTAIQQNYNDDNQFLDLIIINTDKLHYNYNYIVKLFGHDLNIDKKGDKVYIKKNEVVYYL